LQIIIQPQSAAAAGSQLQLVGGQLVQMQGGQTVVYQPTAQPDAGTQTQQLQTIQIQNTGTHIHADVAYERRVLNLFMLYSHSPTMLIGIHQCLLVFISCTLLLVGKYFIFCRN